MASASATTIYHYREERRVHRRRIRVDVSGVTGTGAVQVAHGIFEPENPSVGSVPFEEEVLLTSQIALHRTQPADATNLYYTVDSFTSGGTFSVYVTV